MHGRTRKWIVNQKSHNRRDIKRITSPRANELTNHADLRTRRALTTPSHIQSPHTW
jgi:hypothetical protein